MADNINTNTMVGKVVSVLIALLFIVVLAFPIANSLGNGDNGSNEPSDGGSDTDTERVLLNTLEDEYGFTTDEYVSYSIYESDITPTLPNSYVYTQQTLYDLNVLWNQLTWTANEYYYPVILRAVNDENTGISIVYSPYSNTINVASMTNGYGSYNSYYSITSFSMTLDIDYHLTYTYQYTRPSGSPLTYQNDLDVTRVEVLSNSEDGWIPMASETYLEKISVGCQMIIGPYKTVTITKNMISSDKLTIDTDIEGYAVNIVMDIEPTDTAGVWQFAPSVKEWGDSELPEGVSITVRDPNGQLINVTDFQFEYISMYGTPSVDDGGNGGSGVGGVAGTLIKLVPILLIIGLLMTFIIPMVYKPN